MGLQHGVRSRVPCMNNENCLANIPRLSFQTPEIGTNNFKNVVSSSGIDFYSIFTQELQPLLELSSYAPTFSYDVFCLNQKN